MCGRYTLATPTEALRALFGFSETPNLAPRYNIAPTQDAPVVRGGEGGARHIALLRWGLVPFWAKDASIGNRLINARAEGLSEKPAFREAFRRRRCLVPADGFYEWRREGAIKQPYRFVIEDGRPFAFAGLWEAWKNPADGGGPLETFTIVTSDANTAVRPVHDRMPVILAPGDYDAWLDPETPIVRVLELLRPCPVEGLRSYPVGTRVNSPRADDPGLISPLSPEGPAERSTQP